MSNIAMIVLKNTPKGFRLMVVSEVRDGMGRLLTRNHPLALRCSELMDFLMAEAKIKGIYKTSIKELFETVHKKYGEGFFPSCKILPQTASAPQRLLITE